MHDLSDFIAIKTLFGKKESSFDSKFLKHLYAAIPLGTLHSLYQYDLNLGLKLLRTMSYLNIHRSKLFKQSISFVLSQQRSDGSFGFFAPEILQLQKMIGFEFNEFNSPCLPVAFNSMWTIAEAIYPNFTLFHSIFD